MKSSRLAARVAACITVVGLASTSMPLASADVTVSDFFTSKPTANAVAATTTTLSDVTVAENSRDTAQRLFDTIANNDENYPAAPYRLGSCSIRLPNSREKGQFMSAYNAFREFVGLPLVTLRPMNAQEWINSQAAAVSLLERSHEKGGLVLTHHIPASYPCASAAAIRGASHSNLYAGSYHADRFMRSLVQDNNQADGVPGHRLWTFDPNAQHTTFGIAQDSSYTVAAVESFSDESLQSTPSSAPAIAAWPAPGYFPQEFSHVQTWSITTTGVDVKGPVTVRITSPSGRVRTVRGVVSSWLHAHPTILFQPGFSGKLDTGTYTVEVTDSNGTLTYPVRIFRADPTGEHSDTRYVTEDSLSSSGGGQSSVVNLINVLSLLATLAPIILKIIQMLPHR